MDHPPSHNWENDSVPEETYRIGEDTYRANKPQTMDNKDKQANTPTKNPPYEEA